MEPPVILDSSGIFLRSYSCVVTVKGVEPWVKSSREEGCSHCKGGVVKSDNMSL